MYILFSFTNEICLVDDFRMILTKQTNKQKQFRNIGQGFYRKERSVKLYKENKFKINAFNKVKIEVCYLKLNIYSISIV